MLPKIDFLLCQLTVPFGSSCSHCSAKLNETSFSFHSKRKIFEHRFSRLLAVDGTGSLTQTHTNKQHASGRVKKRSRRSKTLKIIIQRYILRYLLSFDSIKRISGAFLRKFLAPTFQMFHCRYKCLCACEWVCFFPFLVVACARFLTLILSSVTAAARPNGLVRVLCALANGARGI